LTKDLYTVLSSTPDCIQIQLSKEDHPIFKAHFPNNPILPGFLQIDIISEILEDKITTINKSKFISHVCPNDIIEYQIINKTEDKKIITIIKDTIKISEFTYESK